MALQIDVEGFKASLKIASYDDANKESLIVDEKHLVYILDDIAKAVAKKLEIDIPSSCDAVFLRDEKIYLIEFKNREYKKIASKDKSEIRKKAYYSRELLLSAFLEEKTIQYIAENVQLFVVFKSMESDSESYAKFSEKMNAYANGDKPEIKCKLASFEGTYYKNVYTISKQEFESKYMPQIFGSGE